MNTTGLLKLLQNHFLIRDILSWVFPFGKEPVRSFTASVD
jgi:hypothetical protein